MVHRVNMINTLPRQPLGNVQFTPETESASKFVMPIHRLVTGALLKYVVMFQVHDMQPVSQPFKKNASMMNSPIYILLVCIWWLWANEGKNSLLPKLDILVP